MSDSGPLESDSGLPPAKRAKLNDDAVPASNIEGKSEVKAGSTESAPVKKPAPQGWVRAEDGLHGVLVTCDLNREPKCTKEMLDLLNEIADMYFAPGAEQPAQGSEDAKDVALELKRELEALKSGVSRRFYSVQTNCKNMVFIRFVEDSLNPVAVVHKIFEHVLETGEARTRFTNKILPISKTCPSFLDRLVQIAKPLIAEHFHRVAGKIISFMVEYRHRYTDSIRKDESTKELVRMVGRPHRVDLNNPDKVIIVEVFNKALGISIVDGDAWRKYKSYNIRQISEKMPRKKDESEDVKPRPAEDDAFAQSSTTDEFREKYQQEKQKPQTQKRTQQDRWQDEQKEAEDERRQSVATIPVSHLTDKGELEIDLQFAESTPKSKRRDDDSDSESDDDGTDLTEHHSVRLF